MKIVQINSVLNTGSTGRIAEQIGELAIARGHDSLVAYGRHAQESASRTYHIGNAFDVMAHGAESLLLDRHGLGSRHATRALIDKLNNEKPDIIGLHNLHGYFLNYRLLFNYLRESKTPVVWTLHDCWAFTGHCSHFDRIDCAKWQTECSRCPMTSGYPKSFLDFSKRNFRLKKKQFRGLPVMTIVTPSRWLKGLVGQSFLSEYPTKVINNGVNLNLFRPAKNGQENRNLILGVANIWSDAKGFRDFARLRELLPPHYCIALVGITKAQQRLLPNGVNGIRKTESITELVSLYQKSVVFANPTYSDNFPSTNIEALACGTPVVTYDTGGSPEAIDESTGRVVARGDVAGMAEAISELGEGDQGVIRGRCRRRVERLFNQSDRFAEYIDLFEAVCGR